MKANSTPALRVGAAAFTEPGYIVFHQYNHGGTAIEILNAEGESQTLATVCLPSERLTSHNHVWLKGWTENEGVPAALIAAGHVRLTGRTARTGWVEAVEAEIIGKALDALNDERWALAMKRDREALAERGAMLTVGRVLAAKH